MSRKIDLADSATRKEMAEKVRTLRVDRKLSQQELATLVEVSRQTIVDIELGKKVPRAKTLKRILTALGVDVETVQFDTQTEQWMVMFGTFIEAIPFEKRPEAVSRALGTLAADIGEVEPAPIVDLNAHREAKNDSGSTDTVVTPEMVQQAAAHETIAEDGTAKDS